MKVTYLKHIPFKSAVVRCHLYPEDTFAVTHAETVDDAFVFTTTVSGKSQEIIVTQEDAKALVKLLHDEIEAAKKGTLDDVKKRRQRCPDQRRTDPAHSA